MSGFGSGFGVAARVRLWLLLVGAAFSQSLNVWVRAPLFVVLGDAAPDPDETLSAVIGRRAAQDARWARVAEWALDRLMLPLEGWKLGHSARAAALHAASRPSPTAPIEAAPE